jgi:membrane fusion protein (multidrug efflux system)
VFLVDPRADRWPRRCNKLLPMSAAVMTRTREQPDGEPAAADKPAVVKPKRNKAPFVFGGLVLVALGIGGYLYISRLGKEITDDAQVEGHVSNVAPRVAGQVKRVLVNDNQDVKIGDVLVELDDRDQQVKLSAAKADLAAAQAQERAAETALALTQKTAQANLAVARGGVAQAAAVTGSTQAMIDAAKADVTAAKSRAQLAQFELDRAKTLAAGGAVSKQDLDRAVAGQEQADAGVAQAQARLVTAMASRSNSSGTEESARGKLLAASTVDEQVQQANAQVEITKARVAQAQTAVDQAQLNLDYTKVHAELAGVVTKRSVEPGQSVGPDRAMMAVVDLNDTWVVANLKETQLEDVKAGQPVEIEIDTFDGTFQGHVDSISAGTGSRFSLLPADNASGNFTKVTQRVPVKIALDARDAEHQLRPGMSAEVTIHTK